MGGKRHLSSATFAVFCALNDSWQIEQLYSRAAIPDDACAGQPTFISSSRCSTFSIGDSKRCYAAHLVCM